MLDALSGGVNNARVELIDLRDAVVGALRRPIGQHAKQEGFSCWLTLLEACYHQRAVYVRQQKQQAEFSMHGEWRPRAVSLKPGVSSHDRGSHIIG